MRHVLVGTAAAVAFAATFSFSAPKQSAADCPPTLAQPQQIVERQSPSKVRVVLTNAADGLKGRPAEAALFVGSNEDESGEWENQADGRTYWYDARAFLLWQESSPDCNGPDTYWAIMEINCFRHGPGGNANTPCNFDEMFLSLHRGTLDGGTWANPWGYHKYVRANDTGCEATNNGHAIPDDRLARAKFVARFWFINPFNESQLLHHTARRSMTSHEVHRGVTKFFGQDLTGVSSNPSDVTAGPSIC
jgi:hypothetical protein